MVNIKKDKLILAKTASTNKKKAIHRPKRVNSLFSIHRAYHGHGHGYGYGSRGTIPRNLPTRGVKDWLNRIPRAARNLRQNPGQQPPKSKFGMDPDTYAEYQKGALKLGKEVGYKHGKKLAATGLVSAGSYIYSQIRATKEETKDMTDGELSPRQFDRKHGHGRYDYIKEYMDKKEIKYVDKYIKKHGKHPYPDDELPSSEALQKLTKEEKLKLATRPPRFDALEWIKNKGNDGGEDNGQSKIIM